MFRYRLYGLEVASDGILPGLADKSSESKPDIMLHLGEFLPELIQGRMQEEWPIYTSPYRDSQGRATLTIWRFAGPPGYCFRYYHGLTFAISGSGHEIWAQRPKPVAAEDVGAYFLGHILAFVLHLRGLVCLHASAVAVAGKAVLFAGEPGMGKSSTAAAFAERGCPVLADDVSAIRKDPDGKLVVVPGSPRLNLWPDSAEFLYGSGAAEGLPRVQPQEDKRLVRLDSSPGKFLDEPAQLGAIYLLAARSAEKEAPRTEPTEDGRRLIDLLVNGYVGRTLGAEQRASEFKLLGEIARSVPVRRLLPSSDPRKLGELCALVTEECSHRGVAPTSLRP